MFGLTQKGFTFGKPAPWMIPGTDVDLDFVNQRYAVKGRQVSAFDMINVTNSAGYAQNNAGLWIPFAANTPRITNKGLLCENAVENYALHSRDLTNASWTKTNCTTAKTATGIDGVTNSATNLTATAANATAKQTITLASAQNCYSVWLKRVSGSGEIDITINGGTNWSQVILTTSWQQFFITNTVTNPSIGIRIVTNGDEIAADANQLETATAVPTSPMMTTTSTVTRSLDNVGFGEAATYPPLEMVAPTFSIYTEWTMPLIPSAVGNPTVFWMWDVTNTYYINHYPFATSGVPIYQGTSSDATYNALFEGPNPYFPPGSIIRTACAITSRNFNSAFQDGSFATSTSFIQQTMAAGGGYLMIGSNNFGSAINSYIRRFAIAYNKYHSSAQLAAWANS